MFAKAALGRESAPGSQGQDPGSLQPAELLPTPGWVGRSPAACGGAAAEGTCASCSASVSGVGRGRACTLPRSPGLWAADSASDRRKGLRAGGQMLDKGCGENSALAKEQQSPPFPLLCSCCRQGYPASSCFNQRVMAPSCIQFCYPNVLLGHIVLISVNSLHPASIICLRASLNYASNHSDFREDTVTWFLLFSC